MVINVTEGQTIKPLTGSAQVTVLIGGGLLMILAGSFATVAGNEAGRWVWLPFLGLGSILEGA